MSSMYKRLTNHILAEQRDSQTEGYFRTLCNMELNNKSLTKPRTGKICSTCNHIMNKQLRGLTKEIREVCNQKECEEKVAYRYTWPGKKEELICKQHLSDLSDKVNEMGFTLVIHPIMENKEQIK